MSGFNKYLPKNEKIHCLLCLSNTPPVETDDGHIICKDCGAPILPSIKPKLPDVSIETDPK